MFQLGSQLTFQDWRSGPAVFPCFFGPRAHAFGTVRPCRPMVCGCAQGWFRHVPLVTIVGHPVVCRCDEGDVDSQWCRNWWLQRRFLRFFASISGRDTTDRALGCESLWHQYCNGAKLCRYSYWCHCGWHFYIESRNQTGSRASPDSQHSLLRRVFSHGWSFSRGWI